MSARAGTEMSDIFERTNIKREMARVEVREERAEAERKSERAM